MKNNRIPQTRGSNIRVYPKIAQLPSMHRHFQLSQNHKKTNPEEPIFATLNLFKTIGDNNKKREITSNSLNKAQCIKNNRNSASKSKIPSCKISNTTSVKQIYINKLEGNTIDDKKNKIHKKASYGLYEEAHRFEKGTKTMQIPYSRNKAIVHTSQTTELSSANSSFCTTDKHCHTHRNASFINKPSLDFQFDYESACKLAFQPILLTKYSNKSKNAISIIRQISLSSISLTNSELNILKSSKSYKEKEMLRSKCRQSRHQLNLLSNNRQTHSLQPKYK